MKPTFEILRGELERLFSNSDLKKLCNDYLGIDAEETGIYDESKAVLVRRLVDWCDKECAVLALADAVLAQKKGMVDPRLKQIYENRFTFPELSAGTEIGDFIVEKKMKDGGLGSVYVCSRAGADAENSERFGMKILHADHTLDRHATQRFKTLMRILKEDQGEAIQKNLAVGDLPDGRSFVISPWVEGEPLTQLMPLSIFDALDMLKVILNALERVHERGFVHGDLNPGNVLVRPEGATDDNDRKIVLLGFGVDRLFHRAVMDSRGNSSYGMFNGRAPEQARGGRPDVRSDIYMLGAVLHEIVSGKPPFDGPTAIDIVAGHLTQPVPPISDLIDDPCAVALDDIITKMMTKEPSQRPQNLDEVHKLLETARRKAEEIAARAAQTGTRDDIELWGEELLGSPGDEDILQALKDEAKNFNAWGAAVEIMEEAALSADDNDITRRLMFEAAATAIRYVKDYEKASGIYSQFLETNPEDQEAKDAMLELMRAEGRYEDLINELASRAETTEEPGEKLALIREIASVYEDKQKDYSSAFDYYTACLTGTQADKALIEKLETLAERTDRFQDLAGTCGTAAQTAESAGDIDMAVFYYERTGRFYLEKINEASYALTCFQKVLEFRPADTGALLAMTDLYRAAQQWNELAEMLIHLAEAEPTPVASRKRRVESASVFYKRLSNTDRSIELLEAVIADDPTSEQAVDLLAEIYESTNTWDKLAKILSDSVNALPEGDEQLKVRYRLGELHEDRLDDLKSAREQYEKVLSIDTQHLDSIKGLERIYARTGDVAGLRDNLEMQLEIAVTPKQRLLLRERLAGIYEEEFKDYDKAINYLEAVLETDAEHHSSLIALTRLYRNAERWEDISEVLAKRANSADNEEKKALLTERAEVIREKIGDAKRASHAFMEVTSLGVDDALGTLARTQEDASEYDAAIATIRKMIDSASDVDSKVALFMRIASIQLDKMDDATEAAATLRRVKDMAQGNPDVISELRRVLVVQGNYAGALDTLEEELSLVEGSHARAEIFSQMGLICMENIDDKDRAIKYFEQAIELDESNLVAGDNVSTLYRKAGNWQKAIPIYERWESSVDALSREQQIQLFTQMGEGYTHLEQRDKALKAFAKAADIAGEDMRLIRRLGETALELENFKLAREQFTKYYASQSDNLDADEKVDFLVSMARAHIGVEDFSEASKLVRQATVMSPEHREARLLLAEVHEQRGDFRGMVDALERVLATTDKDDPARADLLRRTATVLFEKLKDVEGAAGRLKEALIVNPEDRAVLGDLLKIYTTTKQFNEVIDIVLRIASLIDDPGQLALYYSTAAKIYRRELKRPQKAIEYFELAVEQDQTLEEAESSIVEILTEHSEWEHLESHYKKTIARLPKDSLPAQKLAIYKPLADLLISKLNRQKDGILITEAMAKLEPENNTWKEKLVELYGWEPDHAKKATMMHRQLLATNPARVDSFRMFYRIFSADEAPDKAWCAASLLSLLNQASPEERTYYREFQPEDLPTLSNRLQDEHWSRLLIHDEMNQTISAIFAVIGNAVATAKGLNHSQLGLDPTAALDVTTDTSSFAGFINFAAGAMGITPPPLFYHQGQKGGFDLVTTNPPSIVAERGAKEIRDRMGTAFALGQQLTLCRSGLYVRKVVESGTELSAWLLASIKSFVPTLPVPGDLAGPVSDKLPSLRSLDTDSLERLQGHVQSFVAKTTDVNLKRWARSVDYTMDRAGLLLCGDVAVAVRMLKKQIKDKGALADRLRALTLFTISDEHFQLRNHLGIALKSA